MNKSIMSGEAFNELIDGFEYVGNLTDYGRKNIKYHVQKLQQENKRLKIQVSAREEVANKYKKIIDETRKFIEDWLFDAGGNGASMTYEDINELLQILDKVDKEK